MHTCTDTVNSMCICIRIYINICRLMHIYRCRCPAPSPLLETRRHKIGTTLLSTSTLNQHLWATPVARESWGMGVVRRNAAHRANGKHDTTPQDPPANTTINQCFSWATLLTRGSWVCPKIGVLGVSDMCLRRAGWRCFGQDSSSEKGTHDTNTKT